MSSFFDLPQWPQAAMIYIREGQYLPVAPIRTTAKL